MNSNTESQLAYAKSLRDSGYSLVPLRIDGTKSPKIQWKQFEEHRPNDQCLEIWFSGPSRSGIGLILGRVSGYAEAIDIDNSECFEPFKEAVSKQGGDELLRRLVIVQTPRPGAHILYKCPDGIEGNQVLARDLKTKILIETRGEGGYLVAVGSAPEVHPTKRPYTFLQGSRYADMPEITREERERLFQSARSLNRYIEPERIVKGSRKDNNFVEQGGLRPGDDFNLRASWNDILEPAGWKHAK